MPESLHGTKFAADGSFGGETPYACTALQKDRQSETRAAESFFKDEEKDHR
jgi:hypothetical protein